ncbi:MAG TPA: DUF1501 domain-containing protein [Caulifigura sp.]|nr:DUF1501 domain-containing protein [Caulifigura sp.]
MPNRRDFLRTSAATAAMAPFALRAEDAARPPAPRGKAEHCIMVWLGGGSGQIDTWDPKRLGDNKAKDKKPGSLYRSIDTAIPGVQVCEHLEQTAHLLDRFMLLRTVNHDVIDEHAAATNRMHTGRPTSETIMYPSCGSVIAEQRKAAGEGVPAYVLIGYPSPSRGPGFLGANAGYVYLLETTCGPQAFTPPTDVTTRRIARREDLLSKMRGIQRQNFNGDKGREDYDKLIGEAQRLAGPEFMGAFAMDNEPATLRNQYGGEFGQRCLLSRRLIERGVRFIEVSHNLNFLNGTGWDVHNEGINNQHLLIKELDQALAALVQDLERTRLLDKTLIVVASEFGRPAAFDGQGGRGHHGKCFSVAMAGGGLKTGQAVGVTDDLAMNIVERPISVADMHATMYATLGIDAHQELYANDRPVPITDGGEPIAELFG